MKHVCGGEEEQVVMMRELGKYADTASKDDMTTFLKSGFRAAARQNGHAAVVAVDTRYHAGQVSGPLRIVLMSVDGADAYQVRLAAFVNGAPLPEHGQANSSPKRVQPPQSPAPDAGNELCNSGPFLRRCHRVQRLERSDYPYLHLAN